MSATKSVDMNGNSQYFAGSHNPWPVPPAPYTQLAQFAYDEDPLLKMIQFGQQFGIHPSQLHVGIGPDGRWVLTPPGTSMLVLGQSQSGKSAGSMAPNVLTHPGPIFVASAKNDLAEMTALVRSRIGEIWQLDPIGSRSIPGAKQIRWSPLTNINTAADAERIYKSLYDVVLVNHGDKYSPFYTSASQVLCPLLFTAAKQECQILWVQECLDSVEDLTHIARFLHNIGEYELGRQLEGAMATTVYAPGEFSKTISTAKAVLRPFMSREMREFSTNPNFDMRQFINGTPHDGADTVYFTVRAGDEASATPIGALFMAELHRAVSIQAEKGVSQTLRRCSMT